MPAGYPKDPEAASAKRAATRERNRKAALKTKSKGPAKVSSIASRKAAKPVVETPEINNVPWSKKSTTVKYDMNTGILFVNIQE
jgi:hypothetical protein